MTIDKLVKDLGSNLIGKHLALKIMKDYIACKDEKLISMDYSRINSSKRTEDQIKMSENFAYKKIVNQYYL